MKTKHTKGEWKIEQHGMENTAQDREFPFQIATIKTFICERVEGMNLEESKANAKLIAAAPEMLEALCKIRDVLIRGEETDVNFIINTIKKATS